MLPVAAAAEVLPPLLPEKFPLGLAVIPAVLFVSRQHIAV